jgi:hypothetical protein
MKKRVVVVEPNELLCAQTAEKLAVVDYGITVTSISKLYVEGPWHDVIILNEYDLIVNQSSYLVQQLGVKGLWSLRGRKVIAFSATSSTSHERLINNCITIPTVLKFKSEYEMVKGSSPVTDPTVVTCANWNALEAALIRDLDKHYDQHPVIVVFEGQCPHKVIEYITSSKYKYA